MTNLFANKGKISNFAGNENLGKTLAVLGYFDSKIQDFFADLSSNLGMNSNSCELYEEPHITFLITGTKEKEKVKQVVKGIVSSQELPRVIFSFLGLFPYSKTLFLGVLPTFPLMNFHSFLSSEIGLKNDQIVSYYRTNSWVPHVSLAFFQEGLALDSVQISKVNFPVEAKIERLVVSEMDFSLKMVTDRDDFLP